MTEHNLVLWRCRGKERKGEDWRRAQIVRKWEDTRTWRDVKREKTMHCREERRQKGWKTRREGKEERKQERRGDQEENIVTESDNSRWLNAADGRPARECISILLYKTVHAEQKQRKKKWDTNPKGAGGQKDWHSTCPLPSVLQQRTNLCKYFNNTTATEKRVTSLWRKLKLKTIQEFQSKTYEEQNVILYFTMKCWIWNIFRYLKLFQMKILRFCLQFCNETLSFSKTAHSTQIVKIKSFLWAHWLFVWAHCSMHKLNMSDKAETNAQGHVITLRAV